MKIWTRCLRAVVWMGAPWLAHAQIVASGANLTVTTPNAVATFLGPDLVGFRNVLTGETYLKLPSSSPQLNVETITPTGQSLSRSDWTTTSNPSTATLFMQDSVRTATLTVKVDPNSQEIVVNLAASANKPGVRNASWTVAGLDLDTGHLIVPAQTGVVFDHDHNGAGSSFEYPGVWHAQMLVYEAARGSMLVYAADTQMLFKQLRISSRDASTIDLGLVTEAAAPWPSATGVATLEWRLRALSGDWRSATQGYRTWLQNNRASFFTDNTTSWVNSIRTVVTLWTADKDLNFALADPRILDRVAAQYYTYLTLIYLPVWRKASADRNFPDYTPSPELAKFITQAHAMGFKVMLSAGAYAVSPGSPDYAALRSFQAKDPETLALQGFQWDQPATVASRQALINPASSAYRQLLISRLAPVLSGGPLEAQPDALHLENSAIGIVNDGNGLIDGLTFPQGSEQLHKDLAAAFPKLYMSDEGMNDILYPYSPFAQAWFTTTAPQGHPITNYLFSGRVQYYTNRSQPTATDPGFKQYLVATERRGIPPSLVAWSTDDFDVNNVENARLARYLRTWHQYALLPNWTGDWSTNIIPYLGSSAPGGLTDNGTLARLQLFGSTIYQRVHGVNTYTTALAAPNWPAFNAIGLSGLDPGVQYWLDSAQTTNPTHILSVPAGVKLGTGTMIAPKFAYVETAPLSATAPASGPITIPMVFGPASPLLSLAGDGTVVPVSVGAANITGVPVPGRFVTFFDQGAPAGDGTSLATLPFDISKAAAGELPTSNDFWGFGKLYGVGKVGDATSGGQTKSQAVFAYPENGRTILSWVLRLPDASALQLGWAAGLADGGVSDTGVEFSVRINGFPYWRLATKTNGWNPSTLDLSIWKGQTVLVQLVTDSVGNSTFDNAYWADLNLRTVTSSCTYSIPATAAAAFQGGTANFALLTGATCPWSAASSVPWITLPSNIGIGPTPVSYNVAPNGGAARSGSITVVRQTLTVTQAAGEVPVFTSSGITNGASFAPGLVPGSIVTIFGVRLSNAPSLVEASSIPLPKQLAATSVTVNGIDAPLYYVSATQLALQVPWEIEGQRQATFVVTSNGRSSDPVQTGVLTAQPGVFLQVDKITGVILHADFMVVTPSNPATKGEVLVLYATGLGPVRPVATTGAAAPSSPLSVATPTPSIRVDSFASEVQFAGLASGFVGVYQVNFKVPVNVGSGSVDLTLQAGGITSPPVKVAVQ